MSNYQVTATTTDRERRVIDVEEVADHDAAIAAAIEHLTECKFGEQWTAGDVERGVFRSVLDVDAEAVR